MDHLERLKRNSNVFLTFLQWYFRARGSNFSVKIHPTWCGLQLTNNTTCSLSETAKKCISFTWVLLLCLNYIQWTIWRHYLYCSSSAAVAVWPLFGIKQDMTIWRSLEAWVASAWQSLILPTVTLGSRDTPGSCPGLWIGAMDSCVSGNLRHQLQWQVTGSFVPTLTSLSSAKPFFAKLPQRLLTDPYCLLLVLWGAHQPHCSLEMLLFQTCWWRAAGTAVILWLHRSVCWSHPQQLWQTWCSCY